MRRVFGCALAAVIFAAVGCGSAEAQAASGFVYGGAGVVPHGGPDVFQIGGGFQCVWEPGIGVLAEMGWVAPFDAAGEGVGLLSANAIVSFRGARSRARVRPFVTGGYGMAFREFAFHMLNVGGGVDWSFGRVAWRTELRDHFSVGNGGHFWQVRTGLVWQ